VIRIFSPEQLLKKPVFYLEIYAEAQERVATTTRSQTVITEHGSQGGARAGQSGAQLAAKFKL
jgi:hypothetical protein